MQVNNVKYFDLNALPPHAPSILIEGASRFAKYWLSAGTALGLYRDNDLIEGDTDIDIAMIGYDGIEKEIRGKMADYELLRTTHHEDKPMQLAYRKNEVIFDIYIHWPEGDNYVNYGERGKQIMPARIYKQAMKLPTKYGDFYFPDPIEEYLTIRYGSDWHIPQRIKPHYV